MLRHIVDQLRRGEVRADIAVLGALLTVAIFLVDLSLPLGVAGGIPYIAPVFLAMWLPDRRLIVATATVCSLLLVAGLWLSPPGVQMSFVIPNRILAAAAIWTVALLALQRKEVEAALAASEATQRAALATTVDGILTLDTRDRIASVNLAAERIFGYAEPELLGRPFAELLDPQHRELFEREQDAYLQPNESDSAAVHEMTGLRKSGSSFPVEVVFVPVLQGADLQYTVTVRDITDRRLLEQYLLRVSDEERRALGHSLHEELGQSLTGLGMISQQLARRLEDQKLSEAREASELTALLHEVDMQALKLFQSIAPLDAMGSLGDALEALVATAARRHHVEITLQHDGLKAPLDGLKAAQLYQLVRDMLNTILASRKVERVHVATGRDGEEGRLELRLVGLGEGQSGWAECIRPLAYRAKLVGARLSLAGTHGDESVVTCRWSLTAPMSLADDRRIAPSERITMGLMNGVSAQSAARDSTEADHRQ